MSKDKLNSLEEIRPESSGLKDFVKEDFQEKLKREISKKNSIEAPDNTDYVKYLNLFLLGKHSELEDIFVSSPDFVSKSELKALKLLNSLCLGRQVSKFEIFPFQSPDLITRKKLANRLAEEIIKLYRVLKTNTNLFADFDLWTLIDELPELFYYLSKYLIVEKQEKYFKKIKERINEREKSIDIDTEDFDLLELSKLEKIKLQYLKVLLASRTNSKDLDSILVEYHKIYQPNSERRSVLITKGIESIYKPDEILDRWEEILEEANQIQSEIEMLACIHKFTCEYFSCSDCCQLTFPTMSQTEFIYLKNWMKKNNIDESEIKMKAELVQEDYEKKFGERLKILDKSKAENNLRGIENPYDYKFTCPFLSEEAKCSCHPARPLLCRGFGTATNNGISIKTCNFYLKQYQHNSSPENEKYVFDLRAMEELIRLSDKYLFESGQSEIQEASGTIVAWFTENQAY